MQEESQAEPAWLQEQYTDSQPTTEPLEKPQKKKRASRPQIRLISTRGEQEPIAPLKTISVNELLRKEFEPVRWIVPDILPEGLTLFAAAPKIGKSMVALAITLRMARRVHGGIDGDTLYLSLDDVSERRLQSRVRSLLQGKEVEDHVFFATESCSIDTGLVDQLEMWMQEHPATALVIIDVLGSVKPKKRSDDIYKGDYDSLNPLRIFATRHRIAILLIHHTRKQAHDGDWIKAISGSNGLMGASDTLWYLERERGEQEMTLRIDGREEGLASKVSLTLEDLDLPWQIDGAGTPQELNDSEQKAIAVLQKRGEPLTPKQIAELSGLKNTRYLIRRMLAKKLIAQTTYGKYETLPESSRVAENEVDGATLSEQALPEPTLQDTSQTRVAKDDASEKPCYSATLATLAEQASIYSCPKCAHNAYVDEGHFRLCSACGYAVAF